jgi:micrococcal nuclease
MKNTFTTVLGLVGCVVIAVGFIWFTQNRDSETNSGYVKPTMFTPTLPVPSAVSDSGLPPSAQIVFVPRVIDGDTIVIESVDLMTGAPIGKPETVRYVGMDTPETVNPKKPVECYGHEASERNKALVDGEYVAIVRDVSDRDKYGRLLRFVYLLDATNTLVDLELVREGYARPLTIPPDTEFEAEFKAAAATAKSAGHGFWSACAKYPFE